MKVLSIQEFLPLLVKKIPDDDFTQLVKNYPIDETLVKKAVDFINSTNFNLINDGKIHINGEAIFAIISTYKGKTLEEAVLEAHKKYIDVQYILKGEEQIGIYVEDLNINYNCQTSNSKLTVKAPYDELRDIIFFNEQPLSFISLKENESAVLFPCHAHAPGIGNNQVRKLVVKIKLSI